jgi:uncharacterized protein
MPASKPRKREAQRGTALAIRVVPRSEKDEIAEIMEDGTIKIRITAPPIDGRANDALVRFLAQILDTKASQIEIVAGMTGRNKLVTILGMDPDLIQDRIVKLVKK